MAGALSYSARVSCGAKGGMRALLACIQAGGCSCRRLFCHHPAGEVMLLTGEQHPSAGSITPARPPLQQAKLGGLRPGLLHVPGT